ncbi:helix-turn-helix transcriptional regulator [Corynebacterium sp. 320]|uniref:winged helix-turn-helix transcriptional regulator n=1 Tax=Corynebacterium TaxID=1716 RepID=UPI00125CA5AA|nr:MULTISPECIES: helix-turn-helix domain-containing protein [Corynebacterium]KAB1502794.1 helix-turn-helix transcriptional regulator [Corynebacterium sp. 320]KAB1550465.1 helix-turn-helix transcriptional regulator [Corynebacterium sp. 319]KAB1554804.1 helix-turn-helix transcriptional regulator [Corynebacterium sp. 321]KAB3526457.1 helix-turn-helix transcriptional regulator [Corynebacterium sp. 250]KAB3539776.1 helix-turn-helix transcriptional regulator [Corynebacterium sp. 366]
MIDTPRSTCPINRSLELLGDHWSLLILRDIALYDRRSFRDILTHSEEGISAPMLSRRLKDLVSAGLLTKETADRGKKGRYSFTDKGLSVVPLLFTLADLGLALDDRTRPVFTDYQSDAQAHLPAGVRRALQDLRRQHLGEPTTHVHQS